MTGPDEATRARLRLAERITALEARLAKLEGAAHTHDVWDRPRPLYPKTKPPQTYPRLKKKDDDTDG